MRLMLLGGVDFKKVLSLFTMKSNINNILILK